MTYDSRKDGELSYLAAIEAKRASGSMGDWEKPSMYCSECDRRERDPIFLDVETCCKCGAILESPDD